MKMRRLRKISAHRSRSIRGWAFNDALLDHLAQIVRALRQLAEAFERAWKL